MPYYLSTETMFSAAHTLPAGGDCARMHGHNWRVRVTVRVQDDAVDATTGMGPDFRALERTTRHTVEDFEHRYLNELPAFADSAPSAEHVSRLIYERMRDAISNLPGTGVEEVELWEMPGYRVVYRPA